jgi:hypothetical protein
MDINTKIFFLSIFTYVLMFGGAFLSFYGVFKRPTKWKLYWIGLVMVWTGWILAISLPLIAIKLCL